MCYNCQNKFCYWQNGTLRDSRVQCSQKFVDDSYSAFNNAYKQNYKAPKVTNEDFECVHIVAMFGKS